MQEQSPETTIKRTRSFYIALIIMLLPFILSVNTDLAHFAEHHDTGVPAGFFWIIFIVDFLILLCMVLIYFYKKAGVVLLPFAVLLHFLLHNFYLSTTLYADMFLLFVYCGAGLAVIIPRWKAFR